MTEIPDWTGAACVGMTDLFFLEPGHSAEPAKALCASCPLKERCLEYSLTFPQPWHGIFGGMTVRERMRLAASRERPQYVRPIQHGTPSGYDQHRRRRQEPCERCREAHAYRVRSYKEVRRATAS